MSGPHPGACPVVTSSRSVIAAGVAVAAAGAALFFGLQTPDRRMAIRVECDDIAACALADSLAIDVWSEQRGPGLPLDVGPVKGKDPKHLDRLESRPPDPSEPLCALAFKIVGDTHGELTFTRIYSGTLEQGQGLWNPRLQKHDPTRCPARSFRSIS